MYKELRKHIKDNKQPDRVSSEEAVAAIKELLIKKSSDYNNMEGLEKGVAHAFKTGLSVLGLISGAHFFAAPDDGGQKIKAPESRARQIENAPSKKSSGSFKQKQIGNFLSAISQNESSGGTNLNHKTMKHGMHQGDAATGKYGLMPNTVKDTVNRMGKGHPLYRQYSKMDNSKIGSSLAANPKHEQEIAGHMATRLHGKFGGDESKMSYSWNQGSSLTNDHFKDGGGHSDYKNHDYVQKYHKNRQNIEKGAIKPKQSGDKPSF